MRFSTAVKEPENIQLKTSPNKFKKFFGKFLKKIMILVLVLVFLAALFLLKDFLMGWRKNSADLPYSAVFLSNGQVYFGKIEKQTDKEFLITNVYYLQLTGDAGAQSQLAETKFSLIKLGNELHGPTDELFINKAHVLFYENLRADSKVVESIKNYRP